MSQNTQPILSVIVRRFRQEFSDDIETAIKSIQQAVADQPGFVGLQNSLTSKTSDCELVTIITFDTQEHLERWNVSALRKRFVAELDQISQDNATNTQFGDITLLAQSKGGIKKRETVIILIFWILILNNSLPYPINFLFSEVLGPFWRSSLTTCIIVVLLSYVLLPFSGIMLTRSKAWIAKIRRK